MTEATVEKRQLALPQSKALRAKFIMGLALDDGRRLAEVRSVISEQDLWGTQAAYAETVVP